MRLDFYLFRPVSPVRASVNHVQDEAVPMTHSVENTVVAWRAVSTSD